MDKIHTDIKRIARFVDKVRPHDVPRLVKYAEAFLEHLKEPTMWISPTKTYRHKELDE